MIDFSKYTLTELQAMSAVLDDLTYRMSISETMMDAHMLPYHYYKEVTGAVAVAIDQQARDHVTAEAEKVDLKELEWQEQAAPPASAPPASAPPAENPAALRDMQVLVDTLSWCSNRLAALAAAEDKHFAECSRVDVFNKLTTLRSANWSIIDLLADIRDHYDGLH